MKIKKLIPVLLSAIMCGSLFAGCANNNGNDNGNQHTTHTWSTTYVSDGESGHHRTSTCTEHEPVNEATTAHVYDDDQDATCNNCDYVREITAAPPAHTSHVYKYADESETQHRKTCEGCSEVNELENHTYDNERDTTCNDCDHIRVVTPVHTSHSYKYTSNGASGHTITCEGCSEVNETEAHTFTDDQDTTCNDCDYIRVVTPVHTSHSYKYTSNGASGHTITCEGCDDVMQTEVHTFTDDADTTCNYCDYTRTIAQPEPPATSTPLPTANKIYVVGDSTVCSFNDSYYLPRYGYGTQLVEYLNATSNQIVNLALSGRSSKSFLTESNYTTLTTSIKEGDYLIIGFGHNDEKSDDPARFTSPVGDKDTAGSFQNSLYVNYVKMATDKGATPILCTPITRYDSGNSYTGSKVHVTSDGDYVKAIKDLGEATGTAVIDLTALTVAEYKKDNAAAAYYHAHTTYSEDPVATVTGSETPSGRDDTHINKFGAKMVAYQFANALKSTNSTLKAHVKDNIAAPTKAADYLDAVNKSYVKPDYNPFDPANTTAKKLNDDGWYATAMGALGGDSVSPFEISYGNGTYTVGNATGNKGKIAGNGDGFAAAFIQIDISKNFTASATINLKSHTASNSQAAFGMMLRDDILINTRNDELATNYVAAGALSSGDGVIFSREGGTLKKSGKSSNFAFSTTATYTVSIERVGQAVTVSFSDGTNTYTQTYTDFDFVARDNGYMYLCLFATRSTVAEFTDVQFEITGESQGA